jgi:error-prone DNA polymerase
MARPAEFTHLHVASSYSLRYGTATPAALAARAADLGMSALALTDRDGIFGAFKHVKACADAGIKPLLGADLALRADGKGQAGRVTLLATGRQGWASLCRLVSAAHAVSDAPREAVGDDAVPMVTRELVAEHADGLVLLLGSASDVGQAVADRRLDVARRALDRWRHDTDVVVEIVDHLDRKSTFRAARLAELARDTRTPAVLTNAVRYLDPVDSLTAQVLDAARYLVPLGSPRLIPHNGRAYLASQEDMTAAAKRVAAAMAGPGTASAATLLLGETEELTRKCALDPARDLGVGARHLPETQGTAYDQYKELRDRCDHAILHGRYRTASAANRPHGVSRLRAAETARDRLSRELDIIAQTGMAAYFLTVADVADRIRRAGIRCAIRGSGAGSFVNHLLGISAIDPLEHDLLMERFLSPIRNTLPDIDLDVESARRLDAYRIIFDAYGTERTACVCMMETYRARSAIRDVAAAMSLPPDEIGAIAKAFPHIRAKHITAALTELPELRRSRLGGAQLETVFDIAQQLDGLPRHVAMHPCGVLLSDRTLLDRTVVQESGEGFPLSQLDKDDAEIAGVIKLDVLGVRMQSAMALALAEISRVGGEKIDIDVIPRDDAATYAMIQRAETLGCFQIESPGQRELVKKLAPRDIADLIVDISLFRPGPVNSDMIGPFLRTRHGLAGPRYPHAKLVGALRETGGVVVFHEQVLQIIDVMTGCGLAEADLVRRHLSTEGGPERTAPWFRAQALARGFDPATVERVWEVVAAFGGFGFCKAHAAAFAIPVYQSAWLRRHHPAAFYAGVLTHDPGMYPKRVIIADARLSGVQVLPVDVNASAGDWTVVPPRKETPPSSRTAAGSAHPARSSPGVPAHSSPGTPAAAPQHPAKKETPPSSRTAAGSASPRRFLPGAPAAPPWHSPKKESPVSGAAAPAAQAVLRRSRHPMAKENPASGVSSEEGVSSEKGATPGRGAVPTEDAVGRDRGSKPGIAPTAGAKRPLQCALPAAVSGCSDDRGSSAALFAADDPRSWLEPSPEPSPRSGPDSQPAARVGRSFARRLLETTGPLQALRFPGRSSPPGGRPPVPPDVRAGEPDRKARDRIRPARTHDDPWGGRLLTPASPQAIRCSLREVKGISDAEITRLVAGQPYTSLRDFWNRAGVSRPVTERLVLLGAFDSLYTAALSPATLSSAQSPPNLRVQPSSPPGPPNISSAARDRSGAAKAESDPGPWRRDPRRQGALGAGGHGASPSGAGGHSDTGGSAPGVTLGAVLGAALPNPTAADVPDISDMSGGYHGPADRAPVLPQPTRRDLLARVGVLARQSPAKRSGPPAPDLFTGAAEAVEAEMDDGMADLVPAGQLRELDPTERVAAELEILGFEVSQHVLSFYADLIAGLGVVRSTELADQENGATILVAGAKVATQTPAVRSGQRIIFASLDDAIGLVDLAFFESVQDRCAARLFGSWLLLVRGRVRRAGAGPMAVTVNGTECWDLPTLEEIRVAGGMPAVRAAMAAGDVGPGADAAAMIHSAGAATGPASQTERTTLIPAAVAAAAADDADEPARPVIFANGFTLSPYAETGGPGGSLKHPPRNLWHASPGSTATPN